MQTENSEISPVLQRAYQKNTLRYLLQTMISTTLLLFSGGALIQPFLLKFGVSERNVGIFASLFSFTQVAAMLLCSVLSDKIKDVKKTVAYCTVPQIFFYLAMAFFCIKTDVNANIVFWTASFTIVILGLFLGVINILIYKLPYLIFNMKSYGKITSISGILSGVLGIAVSAGVTVLIDRFRYYTVMGLCFGISAVLLLAGILLIVRLQVVNNPQPEEKPTEKVHFYDVFRHRSFIILSLPNIFRGIAAGMVGMIPVFAVRQLHATVSMTASLAIVSNIAMFLSSFAYLLVIKFMKQHQLCFISTLLYVLPIAGMAFTNNWTVYLALYFVYGVGLYAFSMAVPVFVTEIVPYEIMGAYTSWRMMFTTGGTAIGSLLCGFLLESWGVRPILLCACVLQFICGLVYGIYPKISTVFRKNC